VRSQARVVTRPAARAALTAVFSMGCMGGTPVGAA
jgi:hypothetical protein